MTPQEAFALAQKLLPSAVFTPVANPSPWNEGFKAYEVRIEDKVYGTVFQAQEHVYKVHNRIRYGDRYLKRWTYRANFHDPNRLRYFTSRKAALACLIEMAIRNQPSVVVSE